MTDKDEKKLSLSRDELKKQKLKKRELRVLLTVAIFAFFVMWLFLYLFVSSEQWSMFRKMPIGMQVFLVVTLLGVINYMAEMHAEDDEIYRFLLPFIYSFVKKFISRVGEETNNLPLSLIYLRHIKTRNRRIKLVLLITTMACIIFGQENRFSEFTGYSFLPIVLLSLIVFSEMIVEYRIKMGFFGNYRHEAQEILRFLIRNSNDIDFHDSDGGNKKVLLSELYESSLKEGSSDSLGVA